MSSAVCLFPPAGVAGGWIIKEAVILSHLPYRRFLQRCKMRLQTPSVLCNKSYFLSLSWSTNPENKIICIVLPQEVRIQVNQYI